MAQTTLGSTAAAIGVQGGRRAGGHEEAIEVEAVIWIGIAAIIVIAAVIAAIGRPGGGPGRDGSSNTRRRVGSYSGVGGNSGAYSAGAWSGDSGSGSCGDSSGGGYSGGDCGGGGGSF
ncbi:hypothetical protein [Pseudonocardia sp. DLS-67]